MPPDELELPEEPLIPSELLLCCELPLEPDCPSPCDDELRSGFRSLFWSLDEPLREFVFPWFAILYLPSWTFAEEIAQPSRAPSS